VAGPARLCVDEGELLAAGFTLGPGEEVLVRATRGFTFYAHRGQARVCVVQGSGAGLRVVEEGFRETLEWLRLGEDLRDRGVRRVVIVGPVEAGKSTLTVFLANMLGLGIVETDVGQNETGLPAFVTYASPPPRPVLSLEELGLSGALFVGHVSAERVMWGVVVAAAIAARRLESFVADTDGFVDGVGVMYKAWLAESMEPDVVVSLAAPRGLVAALRGRGLEVVEAPRAPLPRWRSRGDRRSFRARLWAKLFHSPVRLVLEDVPLEPLCNYTRSDGAEEVVYLCGRELIVESARRPSDLQARWARPGWARGLLAGMRLADGSDVPAVVENLDAARGRVIVRAAWRPGSEVRGLRLGWIRLGENFEEEHLPVEPFPAAVVHGRGSRRRAGRG